eukprot:scaffold4278_cov263-Pinguiococcus_pyrenoidosus.AAC.15
MAFCLSPEVPGQVGHRHMRAPRKPSQNRSEDRRSRRRSSRRCALHPADYAEELSKGGQVERPQQRFCQVVEASDEDTSHRASGWRLSAAPRSRAARSDSTDRLHGPTVAGLGTVGGIEQRCTSRGHPGSAG